MFWFKLCRELGFDTWVSPLWHLQAPLWSRLWDLTSRGSFHPCSVTILCQSTSTTWTCKAPGLSLFPCWAPLLQVLNNFKDTDFFITSVAVFWEVYYLMLCLVVSICFSVFFCIVTVGKLLSRIWLFPTAGPKDQCYRGWTSFTLRSPLPSSMDRAPA